MTKSAIKAFKKSLAIGFEKFGNEYVCGLQEGGSLYILLEMTSSSVSQKQQLESKVDTALGTFYATGRLDQPLEVLNGQHNLRMKLFRSGSQDVSPHATLTEALICKDISSIS